MGRDVTPVAHHERRLAEALRTHTVALRWAELAEVSFAHGMNTSADARRKRMARCHRPPMVADT